MLLWPGTPVVAFASSEQLAIGAASAARPPNIVYFVTDDQDQMLGGSFPTTAPGMATPLPKVRELMVEGGATFENMFIHVPICNPSRSTTLTGRYFHNIKSSAEGGGGGGRDASGGGGPGGNGQLEDDTMHVNMSRVHNHSFAVRLQRRGYALGLFGKYLNAMPGNVASSRLTRRPPSAAAAPLCPPCHSHGQWPSQGCGSAPQPAYRYGSYDTPQPYF